MKDVVTWVVLADEKTVKIYENHGRGSGLRQIDNGEMIKPENDGFSDDEGRSVIPGSRSRVRLERKTEIDPAVLSFARQLVDRLMIDLRHERFDQLIVSAAPHMLGILRSLLPDELRSQIRVEINKNFTNQPIHKLHEHFDDVLRV